MNKKLIFSIVAFSFVPALPTSAELIGWWKLDEGTGSIFLDETDYWHDGIINPVNENQNSIKLPQPLGLSFRIFGQGLLIREPIRYISRKNCSLLYR